RLAAPHEVDGVVLATGVEVAADGDDCAALEVVGPTDRPALGGECPVVAGPVGLGALPRADLAPRVGRGTLLHRPRAHAVGAVAPLRVEHRVRRAVANV